MDHSAHTAMEAHELTPDNLKGATIYGAGDQRVGQVSHLHGSGAACQVIVEVGGFLGIGSKPVVVGLGQIEFMRGPRGEVHAVTSWTRSELEAMPMHRD